jgi:hypothetical protein
MALEDEIKKFDGINYDALSKNTQVRERDRLRQIGHFIILSRQRADIGILNN